MGFGVTEDQAKAIEVGNLKGVEHPFGVQIGLRFKTYQHGLMAQLRENFDCLLKMFWEAPESQNFINGQLIIFEAMKAKIRMRAPNANAPIIGEDEINEKFLKSNLKLLSMTGKAPGIEAADKTSAILKGDVGVVEWPELRRPAKWGNREHVAWYGELIGSKGIEEGVREDMEYDLAIEDAKAIGERQDMLRIL
ncbi:hypothetical protein L211DRAFT_853653 [Terfezia boudieri ATCC MYA-4762]|uniref:Uncharacterized protein n=1 Tax=Terfezia boudieri ATCC MYA-4762 TaxID=1051890 RepID=A0A3N4L8L2_9PEZI|nr:hypothetical protein L211DRAFT_853653 [Terfezia boudieri ATCC MYA-4762]